MDQQPDPSDNRVDTLFAELEAASRDQRLPPVRQWNPDYVGEIDIRIASDGRWFHDGGEIKRPEIVRLFSTILRRDDDGIYLVTPVERLKIAVDDAPFIAVDVLARGTGADQELLFTTNVGEHVVADAEHPVWLHNERPYVHVRDGLDALIARPAYYRLVEFADLSEDRATLRSRNAIFDFGSL